jgi:hypothetical protein
MPKIGEPESLQMLKNVFKAFGIPAVVLTAVLIGAYWYYLVSAQKPFNIMFGDELTFTNEGKFTWLIDNRANEMEKIIRVYFVGNAEQTNASYQVRSSEFVDLSGKKLDSSNIKFNGYPSSTVNFTEGWNEIGVALNDSSLSPGVFQGRILVSGNTSETIPMTISTEPLLVFGTLLVIIGALVSVCIWEVVRFYMNKFKNVNIVNLEGMVGLHNVNQNVLTAEIAQQQIELSRHKARNSNPKITIPKLLVMQLISALLGVAIALFGALANQEVIGVYNLGIYQVVTLLGVGLAAGSLKEFVDKD